MGESRFWLHTLGCPKNQVDSDKLAGMLVGQGYREAASPDRADLVVVNTCAFIEAARQESVDVILGLAALRRPGSRLVVTGCMAERYGRELAAALPEVDLVAGFGSPLEPPTSVPGPAPAPTGVVLGRRPPARETGFDLLTLPRPAASAPWAYLKVAEGCDRSCGFCAIPSFRGPQRSRPVGDLLAEAAVLVEGGSGGRGVREIVLVSQDLASYGKDRNGKDRNGKDRNGKDSIGKDRARARDPRSRPAPSGTRSSRPSSPLVELTGALTAMVPRVRLLYLYPSGLSDELVQAVLDTGVPYFDLSLQHVSRPLLASMSRWGDGERFLSRIAAIRRAEPRATFRSSFILGYPGETEEDHDQLLAFLREAELDWAGFFPFSPEDGTRAAGRDDQVPHELALERLREAAEIQDAITVARRDALVGEQRTVLVDAPGRGRTVHEAPEIDGIVHVPGELPVGDLVDVVMTASLGTDLVGVPVDGTRSAA